MTELSDSAGHRPLVLLSAASGSSLLAERLRAGGFRVEVAEPDRLEAELVVQHPDVIVSDAEPGEDAASLRAATCPVVSLAFHADEASVIEAVRQALRRAALAEPALLDPSPEDAAIENESEAWGRLRARVPHAELSPDISALLERAERRVESTSLPPPPRLPRLSPDEELAAVLPAEILEALDEPLSLEEDEDEFEPPPGPPTRTGSARPARAPRDPTRHRTGPGTGLGTGGGETGSASAAKPELHAGTDAGGAEPVTAAPPPPPETSSSRHSTRPPRARADTAPPASARARVPTAPPLRATLEPKAPFDPSHERRLSSQPPAALRERSAPPAARSAAPAAAQVTTKPPRLASPDGPASPRSLDIPAVMGPGDAMRALARAVRHRYTGALAFETEGGIRRVVLKEGDFVTAASGIESESLIAFLTQRGDLAPEAARLARRLPQFGRHAGAALIAHGYLRQDELWPVLRAHAEWLIARLVGLDRAQASVEKQVPGRLEAEPAVFGGATGAEVLVEIARRAIAAETATERLGGSAAKIVPGGAESLLGECALPDREHELIQGAAGQTVSELGRLSGSEEFPAVLYALRELGVIDSVAPSKAPARSVAPRHASPPEADAIDEAALRARIEARKALVDEGDYFAVLGVARNATGYDIRRAFLDLRREFEPARILTAATADLRDTVSEIVEVLEEAYEILSDQQRRERYRRALEAAPRS